MRTVKTLDKLRAFVLWTYAVAVLTGIAYAALTGQETRVTVPGHYQRGGPPCPYDRVLATQFGAAAAELIINKQYGRMVAIQSGNICSIPLEEAASRTKFLPVDHPLIKVARDIGISFGD